MHTLSLLLLSLAALVVSQASQAPQCQSLTIPVTVSSVQQKNLTGPINYSTYNYTYASFPDTTISGSFNISASLCSPSKVNATRSSALQILVHGSGYNRTYWSGLETPPQSFNGTTYSWIDYAASQGYYTLAIDRLCNGDSSRPDASNVCQVQVQAAVMHQIAQKARTGNLGSGQTRAFSSLIYVGHSYGSQLGSYYLNAYASDVNATVLTGFSSFGGLGGSGILDSTGLQPARDTFARFSMLEPTYLVLYDQRTVQGYFYYGSYNPQVSSLDFQGSGTAAYGEVESFPLGFSIQPNVRIPVFVMNGQEDQVSCAVSAVDGFYGNAGRCGDGTSSLTARTRSLFPNAKIFGYFNVPNTGHSINLHYSAPMAFEAAQQFLSAQGF